MPYLTDVELMVLAWPTAGQLAASFSTAQLTSPAVARVSNGHRSSTALAQQIDWVAVRQEIGQLQQDIDRQRQYIFQIRRQLPRSWYRRTAPTVDLEIQPIVSPTAPTVELPRFWQLVEFWQAGGGKQSNPR